MEFGPCRWQRVASMPALRLRSVRILAVACAALGLALPASAAAADGPPYSDGGIPDAIASCQGAPYDMVERDGDLYVRCFGSINDDWRVFTSSASVNATTATITITRQHARGRALIGFQTQPGTATPTIDYLTTSGRVYFDDEQTTATVTVPLPTVPPPPGLSARSFTVAFEDPVDLGLTVPTATVELPATAPAPAAPTIESGPSTTTPLRRATFAFSGEPDATFECRIDSEAFSVCLSPRTVSNVAIGAHRFEVRQSVDGVTSTAASYDWMVAGSPDPGFPSGPPYNSGRLDGDHACEGGLYDIIVRQSDRYVRCLYDAAFPWRQISATASVSGTTATVRVTRPDGTGAPALVEFRTTPGSAEPGSDYTAIEGELFFRADVTERTLQIPVVRDPDATGPRQFGLALSDALDLGLSLPEVDVTIPGPPEPPTIASGPSGEQIVHTASFGFSGANGASFECRIDGAAFAPCTSPRSFTRLPAGERRFEVRQRDGVHGPWSEPAARTWTILPSPDPGYPDGPPYATSTRPIDADYFCDGGFYSLPTHNGDQYLWCLGSNGNKPWQQLSTETVLGEDEATIKISRPEGLVPIVVGFATEADTAVANRDFTPASGELYFAENVTSRTVTIPIVRDPSTGEPRSFSLRLTEPVRQGLGTLPEIDVTIPGNPPTQTASPAVSGTARVGHELTSTDGEWTHQPTSVVRNWERCDATGGDCVSIDDAEGSSYEPTAADVGSRLRLAVTVTNGSGSLSGWSAPSAVVRDALVAPTLTAGPTGSQILHRATFAFTGEDGATFECRLGEDDFAPCASPRMLIHLPAGEHRFEVRQTATDGVVSTTASREWTVQPSPDPGYPLAPPYGHRIDADEECNGGAFQVRTHNADRYSFCLADAGMHAWQRFAATVDVEGTTATVTVTREAGSAAALLSFETVGGTATGGVHYEHREGELYFAPGVTSRTIEVPVVRDPDATIDRTFAVQLRDLLEVGLRVDDETVTIPGNRPSVIDRPSIDGVAQAGKTLTATDGTWTHEPVSAELAWLRCDAEGEQCVPIDGATDAAYPVVDADVGHRLRVRETATNGAGSTEARSEATAVVAAAEVIPPDPGGEPGPGNGGEPGPGNGGEPGPGNGGEPGPGEQPPLNPPTETIPTPPHGPGVPPFTPPGPAPPSEPRKPVRMVTVRMELRFCPGCTRVSARDRKRLQRLRERVNGSRLLAIDGYGDRGKSRSANRKLARSRARAVERLLVSGVRTKPARRSVVGHDRLKRVPSGKQSRAERTRAGRLAERIVTVRVVMRR